MICPLGTRFSISQNIFVFATSIFSNLPKYHSESVRVSHRIDFGDSPHLKIRQNSPGSSIFLLFSIFPNFLDLLSLWSIFLNLAFKKGGNGVPRFPLFPTMQYCSILCNIVCQGSEITSSLSKILLLSSGSRAVSDEGKWNYKAVPGVPNKTGVGNKHPRNWDVSSIFSHFSPFLRQFFPSFYKEAAGGRHKMSPILFAGREGILTTEMYNVQVGELTPSFPFLTTEAPQSGRNRREDSFPSLCQFLPASPHNWETGTAIDGENFLKDRLGEGRDLEDHFLPFITIWMAAQNFHQVSQCIKKEKEKQAWIMHDLDTLVQ